MNFYSFQNLSSKQKNRVRRFLLRNEIFCVQLVSTLKNNASNAYAIYDREPDDKNSVLLGIINIKNSILFFLPFAESEKYADYQKEFACAFTTFFKKYDFKIPGCINGLKGGTNLILNAFSEINDRISNDVNLTDSTSTNNQNSFSPVQINEYQLMVLSNNSFNESLKKNQENDWWQKISKETEILVCGKKLKEKAPELMNQLEKMQCNYEIEEVIPKSWHFDEKVCRLKLERSVQTQYILALKKNDVLVCKAGTNAIGFKYVQLGGIYTIPSLRGNHFATALVQALCKKLVSSKKMPSLFVKIENENARKLYESLGFRRISYYSIAYFNQNV